MQYTHSSLETDNMRLMQKVNTQQSDMPDTV